jgi:oligopeptide/dipeptide ABC transporter ATP-binding protein
VTGTSTTEPVVEELVPPSARPSRRGNRGDLLLDVRGLRTSFHTRDGVVHAVDGIDFHVNRGEIVGLVGESGCGKSVTSLSILRLIAPPGRIEAGEVWFDGQDLLKLPADRMRRMRGNRISMIFQQPTSSLNPVMDVGTQIAEVLEIHRRMSDRAARARAAEMLRMVGIPDPERRLKAFPHEISGGMAQRVMIAMALALEPELLIADEPTTALDVTIQAQILDLMRNLQEETGTAIILITHDLGVVAEMCDRVAVMYAGEIVEEADVGPLFHEPKHPYTQGLIGSIPVLGEVRESLAVIPGSVPNLLDPPAGCRFAPRCFAREEFGVADLAAEEHPRLLPISPSVATDLGPAAPSTRSVAHTVRCWIYHDREGRPTGAAGPVPPRRAQRVVHEHAKGGLD